MPIAIDYTGKRFGRLTAIAFSERRKIGKQIKRIWRCQCDCGAVVELPAGAFTTGNTTSCGCALKEKITKHGGSKTAIYKVWHSMIERCRNPNLPEYKDYGGRDIKVCNRWLDFSAFREDMGPRRDGEMLERKDVNGHYEPDNCRWATPVEQANNRRTNRNLVHNGESMTIAMWARRLQIRKGAILHRLKAGWSIADALTKPTDRKRNGGPRRNLR